MSAQTEQLVSDVKLLISDTESLLKTTAAQAGEKISGIRARAQEAANNLKPQIAKLETAVVEKAKATAAATDTHIRENPWAAIGVSAGIGVIIGLLMRRR